MLKIIVHGHDYPLKLDDANFVTFSFRVNIITSNVRNRKTYFKFSVPISDQEHNKKIFSSNCLLFLQEYDKLVYYKDVKTLGYPFLAPVKTSDFSIVSAYNIVPGLLFSKSMFFSSSFVHFTKTHTKHRWPVSFV